MTDAHFINQRLFRGTLARMSLDGSPRPWLEGVREADWSPDASTLAIVHATDSEDLLEYPIGTVVHRSHGYVSDVRVSPDGRQVAFFEHPALYDDRGFVKLWVRDGGVRTLASEYWGMESLAWRPDGQAVYFAAAAGSDVFYKVHEVRIAPGSNAHPVMPSPNSLYLQDIRRDGRWLIVRNDQRFGIRVRVPGANNERELAWMDAEWTPKLTADASLLMFTDGNQSAGRNYAVAMRKTDGSPPLQLGEGNGVDLSPDGRYALAYIYDPTGRTVVYPTGAGSPRTIDAAPLQNETPIEWFPDSRRIVICGNEPGKAGRCYTKDIEGGTPTPLTPEGFTRAGPFSPDGTSMVVQKADGSGYILQLKDGTLHSFNGLTREDNIWGWTPDGRALLVGTFAQLQIDRLDLATGQRTVLQRFELSGQAGIKGGSVSITPDGRGYAYYYTSTLSRLFEVTGASDGRP